MNKCRSDLQTRSNAVTLPVAVAGADDYRAIITAEASEAAWRIVELASTTGRAFGVELRWSGGDGQGPRVLVSAARSVRVCVFARSVAVRVTNRSTAGTNEVGVTIADGFQSTSNTLEVSGDGSGALQTVTIPAFASTVSFDVSDAAQAANSYVQFTDGAAAVRLKRYFPSVPDGGLDLGETDTISVNVPQATKWRAIFKLAL